MGSSGGNLKTTLKESVSGVGNLPSHVFNFYYYFSYYKPKLAVVAGNSQIKLSVCSIWEIFAG